MGTTRGTGSGAPGRREGARLDGGGPSQVGVSGALRARDVSRPTEEDDRDVAERVEAALSRSRPAAGGAPRSPRNG